MKSASSNRSWCSSTPPWPSSLREKTGSPALEPQFLKLLEQAPSNVPEFGNGANVFLRKVKPEAFDRARVAANYAIQSLARSAQREFQIYAYSILPQKEEDLGSNPVKCIYGLVSVKDDRTLDKEDFLYAVTHFGGLDFRCSVKPVRAKASMNPFSPRSRIPSKSKIRSKWCACWMKNSGPITSDSKTS